MKLPINIQINTVRKYNDLSSPPSQELETEVYTQSVSGYMKKSRSGFTIEYIDNAGLDNAMTTINTLGGLVSLNKNGIVNTHLIFEEGKSHTCICEGVNYPMQVCVNTRELSNSLTLQGGKLDIDYSLEIVGNLAETNRMTLSVAPDQSIITS